MKKQLLADFLIKARTKTYAGDSGKTTPLLSGSVQLEYRVNTLLYRDIFYVGNGRFAGLETIYSENKPVWIMSYFGNFSAMSEKELDAILRKALIANPQTRMWKTIKWQSGEFTYVCEADANGSMDELSGSETIAKKGTSVYYFYYAGGLIRSAE